MPVLFTLLRPVKLDVAPVAVRAVCGYVDGVVCVVVCCVVFCCGGSQRGPIKTLKSHQGSKIAASETSSDQVT